MAVGTRIAPICAGAFILGATGPLDGLSATAHWTAERGVRVPRAG
ncbi:hypothetical protein [Streptosporangium canum]